MKRTLSLIVVFLVLAGLAAALGYFQFVTKPQMIRQFISQAAPPPATVAVAGAMAESWTPQLPAIGSFRAVQGIDVAPQIGGALVAVKAQSGQDVDKGAPLFEIDNFVEQADLKNNLAILKNADFALQRQRQLTVTGNTAKANLDSAEATRDSAAAAVEKVRATIAQKQIVAPFAGRLGIRKMDLGQYVSPGTTLITLQQLDPIYVDFPAPEKWLGMLKPGQEIEVTVDAHPGQIFRGKIETVDARVAADSRNVLVRGLFANKDRLLLPGMFANVMVGAGAPVEVTTVPRTAITYSLYGDTVFVVKPADPAPQAGAAQAAPGGADGPMKLERRFVRLGETKADRVAILDGVKPGELVVSEGQVKLAPDMAVQIDPDAKLSPLPVRPKE
ncbi:efflux RND transporter periplasmic adaptor subunit [Methylocella silvestris]|uniref:Efflux transporter periplasmic adaptor subunit n=1 Tax=Methylocella silvestris TaxID=199596 RepID=A0A2J7TJ70_METSI|nr:efflux RND transporter periplasmic adaptor subunit [Methylocella silvestris]PNG26818.1 efflux transporter periplasmic adaptor subunit [Methylocella silvestris]